MGSFRINRAGTVFVIDPQYLADRVDVALDQVAVQRVSDMKRCLDIDRVPGLEPPSLTRSALFGARTRKTSPLICSMELSSPIRPVNMNQHPIVTPYPSTVRHVPDTEDAGFHRLVPESHRAGSTPSAEPADYTAAPWNRTTSRS
ncbi:hypothetical protein B1H26_18345 [Amycolatopsis sp. BJA-103]|nr:hypothetical protein BKN51_16160 [Amycolatopsis sp. BJA-103]PNE16949.1 hypothetical protein B1H26_18345 [Amycolatopsis sp. BJA-103]